MGVVRDVTVDNLVTAVGNIDTSSLAQDSTLQDVVTAIGNISGGSDPVTNTTVNSLCKDTTGQSIASAISGLGATLGSDRALIDGSNIANPSAFRSAIEACKLRWQGIDATTSANGYLTIVLDNSKPIIAVQIFDANGLMYGVPLISSSTATSQWIVVKDISTNNRVGNTRVTGRAYYLE